MRDWDIYVDDVLKGNIPSGEFIKAACRRFLAFKEKYEFREDKVDRVINFISKLRHSTGKHNGKPFKLEPFQQWLTAAVFGFYKDGKRVIRNVYISVARKNGKSALIAAWDLYLLIADNEAGAEVDLVASNFKQAKILYEMADTFCEGIDRGGKYFKRYRDTIKFPRTRSKLQVLSSEAKGLDGFNASAFSLDEAHQSMDSTDLYDVLKSSQGTRENPLGIVITTSGFSLFGGCKMYEDTCKSIVMGTKEDDSTFAAIYQLDEGDDWADPSNFIKANPALNITVSEEYIKEQITAAKNNPSLETSVRTKNLNQWVSSKCVWIPMDYAFKSTQKFELDGFDTLWCGIDLSAVSDLTAVSFMGEKEDKLWFKTYYFLPEETVEISPNADKYREWVRSGDLLLTSGNVVDYDYILKLILDTNEKCLINSISYDSWNSTQFVINAVSEGLPMKPFSQTLGNFNKPTREFERLIKSGKIVIDSNDITLWCLQNVSLKEDYVGNCKPIKQNQEGKIDGIISMLECLGQYLTEPHYDQSILSI